MSISDELMWRYFELLSDRSLQEISTLRDDVAAGQRHPMEIKKSLGMELVTRFHGPSSAVAARGYFEERHQKKSVPKQVRQKFVAPTPIWICKLMVELQFVKSASEARRLIAQGAVRVDGAVVRDANFEFSDQNHALLEVGKNRIAQVEK